MSVNSKNKKTIVSIVLIVSVLSVITISAILSVGSQPDKIKLPSPPPLGIEFTGDIEKKIKLIDSLPDNTLCSKLYINLNGAIESWHEEGRFGGKNTLQNDQWKNILTQKLYSAYVTKFINQAYFAFRNSSCKDTATLNFIRREYQTLQKSELLEKSGPVDSNLTKIQKILERHDEISNFISDNRNYSFSSIQNVKNRLADVKRHQNSPLETGSVDLCKHLLEGLGNIPQILFNAHVRYLNNKIRNWRGSHKNYNPCKKDSLGKYFFDPNESIKYQRERYGQLEGEIEALNTVGYSGIRDFSQKIGELKKEWDKENREQWTYFTQKRVECQKKIDCQKNQDRVGCQEE